MLPQLNYSITLIFFSFFKPACPLWSAVSAHKSDKIITLPHLLRVTVILIVSFHRNIKLSQLFCFIAPESILISNVRSVPHGHSSSLFSLHWWDTSSITVLIQHLVAGEEEDQKPTTRKILTHCWKQGRGVTESRAGGDCQQDLLVSIQWQGEESWPILMELATGYLQTFLLLLLLHELQHVVILW